jgi:hypothetical protein
MTNLLTFCFPQYVGEEDPWKGALHFRK